MSEVLVSVVTATYNAADVLPRTFASVIRSLASSEIEYIVIDGASDDETSSLINRFGENFSKSGVNARFVSEPDSGIYDAFNKGINLARGKYVAFLNSGDAYLHSGFEIALKTLRDGSPQVLQGGVNDVGVDGHIFRMRRPDPNRFWLKNSTLCHPATFVDRSLYNMIGGFDQRYRKSADLDALLKIKAIASNWCVVDEQVTDMLVGGISQSGVLNYENFSIIRKNIGFGHAALTHALQTAYSLKKSLRMLK